MAETEHFSDDACVKVNAPQVIHETIDGEVIVINLGTGSYYSLKGSGADVWGLIEGPDGVAASDLAAALATRFDTPRSQLETSLRPFLAELSAEELVSWSTTTVSTPAPPTGDHWRSNGHAGAASFAPPVLEKFTDMQDLVLLDPVHEVAATGWPERRPDGEADAPGNTE